MYPNGIYGKIFDLTDWVFRILYLDILWLLGTLTGGVVLGLGPATAAMFAVARKWAQGEIDAPVWLKFWHSYKMEFLQANVLTWIFILLGGFLFADLHIVHRQGIGGGIIGIIIYSAIILYTVTAIFLMPVFVHMKLRLYQYLVTALLVGLASPVSTLVLLLIITAVLFVVHGMLPLLCISLWSYIVSKVSLRSIDKISAKGKFVQVDSCSKNP